MRSMIRELLTQRGIEISQEKAVVDRLLEVIGANTVVRADLERLQGIRMGAHSRKARLWYFESVVQCLLPSAIDSVMSSVDGRDRDTCFRRGTRKMMTSTTSPDSAGILGSSEDDLTRALRQVVSPESAQSLGGSPPDSPAPAGPGETTPQTGSILGRPNNPFRKIWIPLRGKGLTASVD